MSQGNGMTLKTLIKASQWLWSSTQVQQEVPQQSFQVGGPLRNILISVTSTLSPLLTPARDGANDGAGNRYPCESATHTTFRGRPEDHQHTSELLLGLRGSTEDRHEDARVHSSCDSQDWGTDVAIYINNRDMPENIPLRCFE
jgi:hypothetical protein